MKLTALLTVDLNNVTGNHRKKFNDYLEKEKWIKLNKLTTTWKVRFKENVTRTSAINTAKTDVEKAAKEAGIDSYDAAVQVGEGDVEQF